MPVTRLWRDRLALQMRSKGGLSVQLLPIQLAPVGVTNGPAIDLGTSSPYMRATVTVGDFAGTTSEVVIQIQEGPAAIGPWTDLGDPFLTEDPDALFTADRTRTAAFLRAVVTLTGGAGSTAEVSVVLTDGMAFGVEWGLALINLFTAIVDQGLNTSLADITIPAGVPGQSRNVSSWTNPYNLPNGNRVFDGTVTSWAPLNTTEATTVIGWLMKTSETTPRLLAWELFPGPIPLPNENARLTVRPRVIVPSDAPTIGSTVING